MLTAEELRYGEDWQRIVSTADFSTDGLGEIVDQNGFWLTSQDSQNGYYHYRTINCPS